MIILLEMFQVFCFLAVTHSLKHTQRPLSSSPPLAQAHLLLQWWAVDATFFFQPLLARQWKELIGEMSSWRAWDHCNGSFTKQESLLVHPSANLLLCRDKETSVAKWLSVRKSIMWFLEWMATMDIRVAVQMYTCVYVCVNIYKAYIFMYMYI